MAMAHKMIENPNPGTGKKEPKAEPIRRAVRVAIFEDNPMVIFAYREIFSLNSNVRVLNCKPTLSVDEAVALFMAERPDVVITDLSLNDGQTEGFEILRRIKEISPKTPVGLSTSSYHPQKNDEINIEIRKHGFDALFQKADTTQMCEFIEASAPES